MIRRIEDHRSIDALRQRQGLTTAVSILDRTRLHDRLAALADPTRLAILDMLRTRDHCVCHLVDRIKIKQSAVSHHIGVLRRAGLVTSHPHPTDRRWLYYRLDRSALEDVAHALGWLMDEASYDPTPLPCPADEIGG
jgi:ArsR family transcriptional regulator, arsenate/arsenite/antimonite-responsive transcriptional repressor